VDGWRVLAQDQARGGLREFGEPVNGQVFVVEGAVADDHLLGLLDHRQDPWLPRVRSVCPDSHVDLLGKLVRLELRVQVENGIRWIQGRVFKHGCIAE